MSPRLTGNNSATGRANVFANLANSLTTTSAVVAALNSVLSGSLASDAGALLGAGPIIDVVGGVAVSLVSATLHVWYAARFRQQHDPSKPLR